MATIDELVDATTTYSSYTPDPCARKPAGYLTTYTKKPDQMAPEPKVVDSMQTIIKGKTGHVVTMDKGDGTVEYMFMDAYGNVHELED